MRLRVPPRALFLSGIAAAWLAADGLQALLLGVSAPDAKRMRLVFVFLGGLCAALVGATAFIEGSIPKNLQWGWVALATSGVWIWLSVGRRMRLQWTLVGLFVLCSLDLGGVSLSLFAPRPAAEVLSQASETVGYVASQPGVYRVYSPSYSLPQQSAADADIELADGVDPMQLKDYVVFMEAASGVPNPTYSVTLPPFRTGDPATANADYHPDPDLLGLLNVRYVAADFDLSLPDLALQNVSGSTRLYENLRNRPRAWVQLSGSPDKGYAPVEALLWEPNRIQIQASGLGLLVLSEVQYPGWQVWIDGEKQEILTIAKILRAVNLPPGEHRVVFQFRPASLYAGLGLALLGILGIFVWSAWSDRRTNDD
ncbi:MAG: YfhO family protein [Anaerolineales bacterium]